MNKREWIKEYNNFRDNFEWSKCKNREEIDDILFNWMQVKLNLYEDKIKELKEWIKE